MAKAPARLVGSHRCWCCAKEAPVKETSSGKLHASCDWCDLSHYAEPGTPHYRKLQGDTTPIAAEAPAATGKAGGEDPPPAPAPEAQRKRATWHNPLNPGA